MSEETNKDRPVTEAAVGDGGSTEVKEFSVQRSAFSVRRDLSLQFGRVRVGPWMWALGILVHFIIPGLILFGAWGLDVHFGWRLDWPLWLRVVLGGMVLGLSLWVEGAALPQFFRLGGSPSPLQPTESLVVTGPYRYCRHPIYVAYVGYVIGAGILLGLRSAFLVAGVWWLCLAAQARFVEERSLRRRFGEHFEAYRRTTPSMIPRFWRRR
jgi:protein-S-isoprenylcysteine O-methyltransferase Ste14